MKFYFLLFSLLSAAGTPVQLQHSSAIISKTGNKYYRPDDFQHVPARVRLQLNAKHCLIPQDTENKEMINIVSGEFARRRQTDWAAYCSINGKSNVVMLWGGPAHCDGEPFGSDKPIENEAVYKNADPEQMARQPKLGVFWRLTTIQRKQVVASEKQRILAGKLLKSPGHDALQQDDVGGINGVYCMNGKWRSLWYAD